MRMSSEVLSIDPDNRRVTFIRNGEREEVAADVIIGADGAHGICRAEVQELLDVGQPTGLMMFRRVTLYRFLKSKARCSFSAMSKHSWFLG